MTLHFLAISIDWYSKNSEQICQQIDNTAQAKGMRVSGIYDYVLFLDESDRAKTSEKIDKLRKISGVKHTLHLIGAEKN